MDEQPILRVIFYCTESGCEPVREWLKELDKDDRKAIGEDIKLVQFRWPLGMPLVRKLNQTFGKFALILPAAESLACALPLQPVKWPCCMALSRNHERFQQMISNCLGNDETYG